MREVFIVQETTLNIIKEISQMDEVNIDMDFESLNLNSISFITMVVQIESAFDFEFDDEMLLITKFPTVRSIVDYVESKLQG